MKKGLMVVFVSLFLFSFVLSGSCDDNQTIFKQYQENNSHAALWNDTYTYDVCYNEKFGPDYSGADPHACTANNDNVIFWLTDSTNTHVSAEESTYYNIPVCYGKLVCEIRGSCVDGEVSIASLYNLTNSHVSAPGVYDYEVCCIGLANEIAWKDMNGNVAQAAGVGDNVLMTISGTDSSANLTYTVYEEDSSWFWFDSEVTTTSGSGSVAWQPEETGTYYFEVKDSEGNTLKALDGSDVNSGDLVVSNTNTNDPINITINSPLCGSNYSVGTTLGIEVSAFDSDDLLFGNITVGGVWIKDLTNGINTINHPFGSDGDIQIIAHAINNRGQEQKVISNIMVVGALSSNNYTASCIDEPKNFDKFASSLVKFNARSSSAISCQTGVCQRFEYNSSHLRYLWEFSTCVGDICDTLNKTGSETFQQKGNDASAYDFLYQYTYPGSNWAELEVQII